MDEFETIVARLRKMVDQRHKAGHKAIDDLIASFAAPQIPGLNSAQNGAVNSAHVHNGEPVVEIDDENEVDDEVDENEGITEVRLDSGSNVDRVLAAISLRPRTVSEIVDITELTEKQVRGVLGSPSLNSRIRSRRIGKRAHYAADRAAEAMVLLPDDDD
ncbi:MAG TPA: hypothetical protein VG826_26920 [Pirellulales bacterium]|nr:hypothetical protein [Pirellulales bacterium]